MKYKGIKLNGLLLLLIIIASIGVYFYTDSLNLGTQTVKVLENIANVSQNTMFVWWASAIIPLLFFSIYFTVRRVLYKAGSLIAYATNAGIIASIFSFLDLIRLPTINIFLANKYVEGSVFQKGMIELIFEVLNQYFYYIGKLFAPIFFNIWLLFVGISIIKTSSLKRVLGFLIILVSLIGFATLFITNATFILIYYIAMWFILFLIAIGLILF